MSHHRPIETRYKGFRFRSRLEARWAVFFDRLRLPYEYEPEGFATPHGPYLPDFRLRGVPSTAGVLWVEIRPKGAEGKNAAADWGKLRSVCLATAPAAGTMFYGDPLDVMAAQASPYAEKFGVDVKFAELDENGDAHDSEDVAHCFCQCPRCGRVGFEYHGRGSRVCGKSCPSGLAPPGKGYNWQAPRILRAARAARAARFEHGESPA